MENETVERKRALHKVNFVKGEFIYEIQDYTQLRSIGGAHWSPVYTLCGHKWRIKFYPDGSKAKGHLSVFIENCSTSDIKLSVKFTLLDQLSSTRINHFINAAAESQESGESLNMNMASVVLKPKDDIGFHDFVKCDVLLDPRKHFCENNVVILVTELIVHTCAEGILCGSDPEREAAVRELALLPSLKRVRANMEMQSTPSYSPRSPSNSNSSSSSSSSSSIINNNNNRHRPPLIAGVNGDVTLRFNHGGGIVSLVAHKFLLSIRSPVFGAMFSSDMTESVSNEVNLGDDVDPDIFAELLNYIYTDTFSEAFTRSPVDSIVEQVFNLSMQYQVLGAAYECEKILISLIKPSNALSLLTLANAHEATELKQQCLIYLGLHAAEIFVDTSPQRNPLLLINNSNNNIRQSPPTLQSISTTTPAPALVPATSSNNNGGTSSSSRNQIPDNSSSGETE